MKSHYVAANRIKVGDILDLEERRVTARVVEVSRRQITAPGATVNGTHYPPVAVNQIVVTWVTSGGTVESRVTEHHGYYQVI